MKPGEIRNLESEIAQESRQYKHKLHLFEHYLVLSVMRGNRDLTLKKPEERQNLESEHEFEYGDLLKPTAGGRATNTSANNPGSRISRCWKSKVALGFW